MIENTVTGQRRGISGMCREFAEGTIDLIRRARLVEERAIASRTPGLSPQDRSELLRVSEGMVETGY